MATTTTKTGLGRRGAALRAAVLAATIDELIERGVGGLSVAAVARRTGVHETSVYRRWQTREDLIVDALLERSAASIPPPDTGTIEGDLIEIARLVIEHLSTPLGAAMVRVGTLPVQDDALVQARGRFFAARIAALRGVIDRAVERGELRSGIDAGLILELLVAPLHARAVITGLPLSDGLAEAVVGVLLDGLRPATD